MSDEAGLISAILSAPEDDTLRLVYADWLEERGEFLRANYLRLEGRCGISPVPAELECHWDEQLPPPELRYSPVLRRLTEAAKSIAPGWLASVSRIRHEILTLLRRVTTPISGSIANGSIAEVGPSTARWQAAIEDLRELFEPYVGEETTRERLSIPVDYTVFTTVVSGGLAYPEEGPWDFNFDALFDLTEMVRRTIGYCSWEAKWHGPGELWLFIGHREKRHFHLCCDWASPYFGLVVELEDRGPWMCRPWPYEVITRGFLDYLRWQVADAERYRNAREKEQNKAEPRRCS